MESDNLRKREPLKGSEDLPQDPSGSPASMALSTPFNMILVGMTACGKTHYLLELLEADYMKHFEYIVLLCPTFEWNKTYHQ